MRRVNTQGIGKLAKELQQLVVVDCAKAMLQAKLFDNSPSVDSQEETVFPQASPEPQEDDKDEYPEFIDYIPQPNPKSPTVNAKAINVCEEICEVPEGKEEGDIKKEELVPKRRDHARNLSNLHFGK